ncbi:hypothetical protein [Chitinophaga caeni]|nr:hypothetical protein [Chitinophaga caeni]
MKMKLLMSLAIVCLMSVYAKGQSKGKASTKYLLFNSFDEDIRKLNIKPEEKMKFDPSRPIREQIFTNYRPSSPAPARKAAAQSKASSNTQLPSAMNGEQAKKKAAELNQSAEKAKAPEMQGGMSEPKANAATPTKSTIQPQTKKSTK